MKLRLEADDILYMVLELACANIEHRGTQTGDALQNAHCHVQEYLGINIEFMVEGYDGLVHDPCLVAHHEKIMDDIEAERNGV